MVFDSDDLNGIPYYKIDPKFSEMSKLTNILRQANFKGAK